MTKELPEVLRWTPKRKAELLHRIASGEINAADAMKTYRISAEELHAWAEAQRVSGTAGLYITKPRR